MERRSPCYEGLHHGAGGDGTEAAILAFEPCNENDAITEVVFAVVGLQGFTPDDRNSVKTAHSKWQALLPSLQEEGVLNIAVAAPDATLPPPPIAPLAFARFRANGEMEWRLLLTQDALVVNCCSYTSWKEVWTIVRDIFANVAGTLRSREQKIRSVSLEYADLFRSVDNDHYDARDLLQESDSVPSGILTHGPVWHLHQGWFEEAQSPVSGHILRRMHISSTVENNRPQVRFDTNHRFDMRDAPDLQSMFVEPDTLVDSLFDHLHRFSKALLADFLTAEMAQRINLHAD